MRALVLVGCLPLSKRGVMYLGLCTAAAFSPAIAYAACPEGTVFSAFNGRGICAKIGKGAEAAAICFVTRTGKCPDGFTFEHKNSDPTHSYCCPETTDHPNEFQCRQQCKPLLSSVHPQAEAERVYNNCVVGCFDPNGLITCRSGHQVSVGTPCN